ncbi:type I CRISPR-associated protein Cas7 [Romboutsia lituseburensis]|uniref:type I CRISPR-associated protein Cas7 n=1 Tax=Romboutsia lituseburensis TaxID=1537 RepID=UPI00215A7D5C|nr:type I CRISPR-associated protein Cas7 [Romboutsia lituseburensis]MCR8744477.1 type I CRISPR-associated protein Cas7 [Romboutsia lituseburensis]
MNKRVYGAIGIVSKMANWNADFTGYPKTTSDGETFGSDKALKYPMKKMWENQGEKVLYIKTMKLSENKGEISLVPRSLKERYEHLFNVDDLKNCKDSKVVLTNLFNALDVKNFGATFAESGNNISITGAVQIGQGFNKFDGTSPEEQQILSPFRDASKDNKKEDSEEAKNSTLGTKIVSNEAHYFYPFTINTMAYKEFKELGVTDGYTEEDYSKFKKAALVSATSFATNAKAGCDNEFALFVETESDLYLPNLDEFIEFTKGDEKNTIKLNCSELLNSLKDRILKVEIYYNPYTTNIESEIEGAKKINIFTQKEV